MSVGTVSNFQTKHARSKNNTKGGKSRFRYDGRRREEAHEEEEQKEKREINETQAGVSCLRVVERKQDRQTWRRETR